MTVETRDLQGSLAGLLAWAASHRVTLSGLRAETATLERAFLALTHASPTTAEHEESAA